MESNIISAFTDFPKAANLLRGLFKVGRQLLDNVTAGAGDDDDIHTGYSII